MGLVFSIVLIAVIAAYIVISTLLAMFLYWLIRKYLIKNPNLNTAWKILLGCLCMLVSVAIVVLVGGQFNK